MPSIRLRPQDERVRPAGWLSHDPLEPGGSRDQPRCARARAALAELWGLLLREDLRDNRDLVGRFVEESQIGGQLQHLGVVPMYELGTFADRCRSALAGCARLLAP